MTKTAFAIAFWATALMAADKVVVIKAARMFDGKGDHVVCRQRQRP